MEKMGPKVTVLSVSPYYIAYFQMIIPDVFICKLHFNVVDRDVCYFNWFIYCWEVVPPQLIFLKRFSL